MDVSGLMSSSGKNNNNSNYYAATSALLKATMSAGGSGGSGGGGGGSSNSGGGGGGGSSSQHRPKFVIPIPPVPHEMCSAVREQSHSKEKAQIHQLHAKLNEQRQRARDVETEIAELERSKLDATRRLEEESQRQARIACDQVEEEARAQYELDKARRRDEWRRKIEEECQRDFRGTAGGETASLKSTNPESSTGETASDPADVGAPTKQSHTTEALGGSDDSTIPQQQEKPSHGDESAPKSAMPVLPPSKFLLAAEADERAASSRLAAQQEVRQEAQQQLDKLQERRGEIVWLLKQVIKAEEKAKAKRQQAPPDAK